MKYIIEVQQIEEEDENKYGRSVTIYKQQVGHLNLKKVIDAVNEGGVSQYSSYLPDGFTVHSGGGSGGDGNEQ